MAAIRVDGVSGRVENSGGLTETSDTLQSGGLKDLPEVAGGDFARLVMFTEDFESGRVTSFEIVHVTAHTTDATSATILRGQEGTTGRTWGRGVLWRHVDTAEVISDLDTLLSDHSARHQLGGADVVNIGGLSGELADPQTAKAHGNEAHSPDFATDAALTAHEGLDAEADDVHGAKTYTDSVASGLLDEVHLRNGTTVGATSIDDDDLVVDVETVWGIGDDGPYYDPVGPDEGEAAVFSIESGQVGWTLLSEVS